MANRLTKITTRTGDDGTTGLGDGTRIQKSATRVELMGDIDEANSAIGLLLVESLPTQARVRLVRIQHNLFDLGGEICIPGHRLVGTRQVAQLDEGISELNADLSPLKEFVLPGGSRAAAQCHVARTVVRRAERTLAHLQSEAEVSPLAMQYLNRLSDFLFVLARTLNQQAGTPDVLWQREASPGQAAA